MNRNFAGIDEKVKFPPQQSSLRFLIINGFKKHNISHWRVSQLAASSANNHTTLHQREIQTRQ